jgi:hypothetical protein
MEWLLMAMLPALKRGYKTPASDNLARSLKKSILNGSGGGFMHPNMEENVFDHWIILFFSHISMIKFEPLRLKPLPKAHFPLPA